MNISQTNEELDILYQVDHTRTSDPQLNNDPIIVPHSLTNSDINDKVDIKELYLSRSSRYEETSSSN